jgi:hypothetical protein
VGGLASAPLANYSDEVRLASDIWVKAYLRRCAAAGAACVLARRGDGARGAIFIKVSLLDGSAHLLQPAPAGLRDVGPVGADAERRWRISEAALPEAEIDAFLARQVAFDPDLWILAVEDRSGRHFLDEFLARA